MVEKAFYSNPSSLSQQSEFPSAVRVQRNGGRSKRASTFPTWLLLTAILAIPSSLAVHLSGNGAKFTPGRAAIALLLIPALLKLLRSGRRFVFSDLCIILTSAWMIGSRFTEDGLNPSAVAEVIELLGGYIVARAYFFGRPALEDFTRVFKILMVIVILLASLEPLTGRDVIITITSGLFGTPLTGTQTRHGIARAMSTIEDAELYGTVCCIAGAVFLYMTPLGARRLLWTGFCFFGCLLSLSSGPLLVFVLMFGAYTYDRMLKSFAWRWKVLTAAIVGLIATAYIVSNNPTDWIISHLTLDPSTGYFRMYADDYAFSRIALHPFQGWGFGPTGESADDFFSNMSIDSVWLVSALRYGLPMMFLLLLTNVATFYRVWPRAKSRDSDAYLDRACTAFTFAIVCLMSIGLTVHYWNAAWMLWAVCLGTRASIKEAELARHEVPRRVPSTGPMSQRTLAGVVDRVAITDSG